MEIPRKLAILADAAKYDASCASSGGRRRGALDGKGIGSVTGAGICHSYTPDGRCVSLLKILLTNFCVFDCSYCINRRSSNVERARFTTEEVVQLTLDFYKRNYIEGLFLSSGIIRNADYTMEQLLRVAKALRLDPGFRGYIHLKMIPDAARELIEEAGLYADRLSVNIEMPTRAGLARFAPEKNVSSIRAAMGTLRLKIEESGEEKRAPRFAPAGQSTQMIVGADAARDDDVLATSAALYGSYGLKRVYYSAFSPIPDASSLLPVKPPPLAREHRLYQADWLYRFYGFSIAEIVSGGQDGMLALDVDPKTAWALAHRELFPIDVNTVAREMLLRVPGLGVRNVDRIVVMRRQSRVTFADLARLKVAVRRIAPFIVTGERVGHGRRQAATLLDRLDLRGRFAESQADLFASPPV